VHRDDLIDPALYFPTQDSQRRSDCFGRCHMGMWTLAFLACVRLFIGGRDRRSGPWRGRWPLRGADVHAVEPSLARFGSRRGVAEAARTVFAVFAPLWACKIAARSVRQFCRPAGGLRSSNHFGRAGGPACLQGKLPDPAIYFVHRPILIDLLPKGPRCRCQDRHIAPRHIRF